MLLAETLDVYAVIILLVLTLALWRLSRCLCRASLLPPSRANGMTVKSLTIHPIKGCKGTSVTSAATDRLGFINDRRWMVVDMDTFPLTFASQREYSKMALIHPQIEGNIVRVTAPGMDDLTFEITDGAHMSERLSVQVWGTEVVVAHVNKICDAWFSKCIGANLRFVSTVGAARHVRPLSSKYVPYTTSHDASVGFADGFPFLLIGQSSLDDVNVRVGADIKMESFRPNIVVSGSAPWEEDHWKTIRIGGIVFDAAKPCSRCQVPTIDPDTGNRRDKYEPIKTMRKFRVKSAEDDTVYCGQNLVHMYNGVIAVGDEVTVTGYKKPVVPEASPLQRFLALLK